jgi:hypothetical protein
VPLNIVRCWIQTSNCREPLYCEPKIIPLSYSDIIKSTESLWLGINNKLRPNHTLFIILYIYYQQFLWTIIFVCRSDGNSSSGSRDETKISFTDLSENLMKWQKFNEIAEIFANIFAKDFVKKQNLLFFTHILHF